jgi:hypothetical protein
MTEERSGNVKKRIEVLYLPPIFLVLQKTGILKKGTNRM